MVGVYLDLVEPLHFYTIILVLDECISYEEIICREIKDNILRVLTAE